jgi:hypothetical protein
MRTIWEDARRAECITMIATNCWQGFLAVSYLDPVVTISHRPSADSATVSQVTVAVPAIRERRSYVSPCQKANVYRQYRRTGSEVRPNAARAIRCVDSETEGRAAQP